MKWISSAYIKILMKRNPLLQGNSEYELWKQTVEKVVDAIPGIDIVRCSECKYGEYREDFDDFECQVSGYELVYDGNFFCADGEVRDE